MEWRRNPNECWHERLFMDHELNTFTCSFCGEVFTQPGDIGVAQTEAKERLGPKPSDKKTD
jgi:ribosomal protein S27E